MRMPNGNVLVRRMEVENTYGESNIVIPDNAKEKPAKGVVVAAQEIPGRQSIVGEHVLFGKYTGIETNDIIVGETPLIMHEDEILCILDRV